MRQKLILDTAYKALQKKGEDLTPNASLDALLLQTFSDFPETIDGLESFYDFLRYEACIYTDEELETEADYHLVYKSSKYNLVTF